VPANSSSFISVQRVLPDDLVEGGPSPGEWPTRLGLLPKACTGLIVLADPFSTDVGTLIAGLERDYPGVPLVGGLASGHPSAQHTHVFFGTQASGQGVYNLHDHLGVGAADVTGGQRGTGQAQPAT
jgi:small ligand-binding sensory domain FIST